MIKRAKFNIIKVCRPVLMLMLCGAASHTLAQPFEQVAVGASHICALDASGQTRCTATNIASRLLPPENLPLFSDIVAGQQHTCGITLDGEVECFGVDAFGVLDVPTFEAPVESITAGSNHNCAIDSNNQVQCWGLNSNNQLDVPDVAGGFVKVDAARTASCGIDTVGDIHCWTSDFFFNTDPPIAGPFTDLDLDSNAACALTINGEIECFAIRDRQNLTPPTNGPYIDLTVTNSAICGLRTDQSLDCSFPDPDQSFTDVRADEYPLGDTFSSIERSAQQFSGVPICGLRADNGTITCFGDDPQTDGSLPAPPGTDGIVDQNNASNIVLGLAAKVYGPQQVELFWNRLPSVFPPLLVEVYRDGQLLTTTSNNFSFYDNDSSVSSVTSQYQIRPVDENGNTGQFSNTITVNRINDQVVSDDTDDAVNPRPDSSLRLRDVTVNSYAQFDTNNNLDVFVLSWSLDNPADTSIAGFEIRIDEEVVGFVKGTTFSGDGVDLFRCRIYSVAAIAENGEILDYGSAALGRNAFVCPR